MAGDNLERTASNPAVETADTKTPPPPEHDAEKGKMELTDDSLASDSVRENRDAPERQQGVFRKYYKERNGSYYAKHIIRGIILALFTGWWIASLVLHHDDKNWVIPFLLWLAIFIRITTFYFKASIVLIPAQFIWQRTAVPLVAAIPQKWRTLVGAVVVIAAILVGAFVSEETEQNTLDNRAVSLFGLLVFIFVLWATSRTRSAVNWHTVLVGMLMQYIIALFVLRTRAGYDIFKFISDLAVSLLGFAKEGVAFLTNKETSQLGMFFFTVLPAIVFFIALVQMLYYYEILHWFVAKFANIFFWSMDVSGAEAVVAAASPFIGQGESALLIKPFVPYLTMAELHQVMCSGFATIAGSVLVAYLGMGINPQALISSCVMSIPASLAVSKLRYPETEESLTAGKVVVPKDKDDEGAANGLHAFANGTWLGLKIAAMIMGTQMCIIAFIALIDALLGWWGYYININVEGGLTIEFILGYVLYPVSFLLGVSRDPHNPLIEHSGGDIYKVAKLIGLKLISNEFVAYIELTSNPYYSALTDRSRLIATYALCGFANVGSLGTQIGVLSQVAPGRGGDVSRLAVSALISGALSTLTSASVAGLVVTDQASFISTTAS